MKRKQPATEYTIKMSTTDEDAPYKEFSVGEYQTGLCTGGGASCPIGFSRMIVKTSSGNVLTPEQLRDSATDYTYKCEWFKNQKCANPFGDGCPTGKLDQPSSSNFPICNFY